MKIKAYAKEIKDFDSMFYISLCKNKYIFRCSRKKKRRWLSFIKDDNAKY